MLEEMNEIDMTVIEEQPLIVLEHTDYNCSGTYEIYANMLRKADIGTTFYVSCNSACGRDVYDEELKVLFKDNRGCLCVLIRSGTTDDPNPEKIEYQDKLIWFRLRD